ncbi:hypothetical protein MMC25_000078 [Agyrium rufum]|nr:hypothetical protein [Agyrium rufum]
MCTWSSNVLSLCLYDQSSNSPPMGGSFAFRRKKSKAIPQEGQALPNIPKETRPSSKRLSRLPFGVRTDEAGSNSASGRARQSSSDHGQEVVDDPGLHPVEFNRGRPLTFIDTNVSSGTPLGEIIPTISQDADHLSPLGDVPRATSSVTPSVDIEPSSVSSDKLSNRYSLSIPPNAVLELICDLSNWQAYYAGSLSVSPMTATRPHSIPPNELPLPHAPADLPRTPSTTSRPSISAISPNRPYLSPSFATSSNFALAPEISADHPYPEVIEARHPSAVLMSLPNAPGASEFAAAATVDDDLLNGPTTPRPGQQHFIRSVHGIAELQGSESIESVELEGESPVKETSGGGNEGKGEGNISDHMERSKVEDLNEDDRQSTKGDDEGTILRREASTVCVTWR